MRRMMQKVGEPIEVYVSEMAYGLVLKKVLFVLPLKCGHSLVSSILSVSVEKCFTVSRLCFTHYLWE